MGVRRIAKPLLAGAVILLACSFWPVSASATAIPANETGTVRAVFGFRFPTFGNPTITSGLELTSLGPKALTVGHFDANGAVVNGDVAIREFINLGTAPMDKIFLPGTLPQDQVFVTPQAPRASGILNAEGFVIPPDFFGIEPE